MSDILSRSGLSGRAPLPAPRGIAYDTTAIQAAWATLLALRATGERTSHSCRRRA